MSTNKVFIHGYIGGEIKSKDVNGRTMAYFSVATTETWKDQEGNKKERTDWHNIIAWGPKADLAMKHLGKGREIIIVGKIKYNEYEDAESHKKHRYTAIEVSDFDFCGKSGNSGAPHEPPIDEAPGGSDNNGGSSNDSFDDDQTPF